MMVDIMNARLNFTHRKDFINPLHYLKEIRPEVQTVHRYIQTHPDMDHMDGLNDLVNAYDITNFWDSQNTKDTPKEFTYGYREEDWNAYQELRKSNHFRFFPRSLRKIYPEGGEYIYNIYSLSPTAKLVEESNISQEWNGISYIILLEYQGFKLLLGGDADDFVWDELLEWSNTDINVRNLLSDVSIFRAGHHGRKSSYCGNEFLKLINPQFIVLSKDFVPSDESGKLNYQYFMEHKEGSGKVYDTIEGKILIDYHDTAARKYSINQYEINNQKLQ
jgi:beta-lactamase superfamily II metal-dependent hydrolase